MMDVAQSEGHVIGSKFQQLKWNDTESWWIQAFI